MLKNYILTSLRSLKKKIGFSIVNIVGLSLGMATCLMMLIFVNHDLSYDDFQSDQVYRVALDRVYPERQVSYTFIPHSIGPQINEDFPDVVQQTRLFQVFGPQTVKYGEDNYLESKIIIADSTLFQVFNIPLKEGDPQTAMVENDALVISESTAKKIFGEKPAIGQIVEFPNGASKVVTAVTFDYPETSHLSFDYIYPMHSLPFFNQPNWLGFSALTYIKINDGVNPKTVEERIPQLIRQYADGQMRARNGLSYDEYIEAGNGYNYFLQPIKDIHLYSHLEGELKPNGNINYIYIFSLVAVFILVIACINFMNLSTARSTERGKEVGIRKVLGSSKNQLIGQFLTESIIVTLFSALLAFVLAYISLPYFSEITDRSLNFELISQPSMLMLIGLIIIFIGALAGAYPAFFISSFKPVSVLKGRLKFSNQGVGLRNVLVVLQFSISIALISASMLVQSQMDFLLNKPLGFEKENILVIENVFAINNTQEGINWERFETFKNELEKLPSVNSVSLTSAMPGDILPGYIVKLTVTSEKESLVARNISFDNQLAKTLDIKVLEGRFFSDSFNDSLTTILNRSAVEKLGLVDPVGKKLINVVDGGDNVTYDIIGVVEDFHFQSLHVSMEPIVLTNMESQNGFPNKMVLKLDADQAKNALAEVEFAWNSFSKNDPFQSYYLDTNLAEFYEAEEATGKIFSLFTFLAIVIACVGLLGLSSFVINQRVKEIGVRKVLGASLFSIISLLSIDFIKLIGIAAVIAVPLAYLWMDSWIESFAYATQLNWSIFIFSTVLALFIGLATVSVQAIKAALGNPVKALKDE
ncbi:MAG: ABC transporter permease [Cyclobacteriaceae bacterium]